MLEEGSHTVLDEDVFPIVGWAGPSGEMIRDEIMAGMAEAGFTVSHSSAGDELDAVLRALDVAHGNGVRLLLNHPVWHVGDEFILDEGRKQAIREVVQRVKDHPGLYGYALRDEPRFGLLETLAQVSRFIRTMDESHICYINHYPPIRGFGAPTVEAFWQRYIELVKPQLLSYDHYPITIGTQADVDAQADAPHVFPEEKIVVKPDYFECLELLRTLSVGHGIPFWAFTCSVRHGAYPTPTEGHLRFQLMNDLAYGARGLQYFTYAHDGALVRPDGSFTETWEMARRINAEVHTLAPILRKLRNVGVFRTGPLWSGTRRPQPSDEPLGVFCEGDPVTIGFFLDPDDLLHLFVVNGNPCSWARITLKVNVKDEKLYMIDPKDRTIRELWPPNARNQLVTLAPGEGRLFQVGGPGEGKNF